MSEPPVEDDCPLCLEPLPPFWDVDRWTVSSCCGKATCKNCYDKRKAYLDRAFHSGSFGREEEQLANTCPLCRARKPPVDDTGRVMVDTFEKGKLPLGLYCSLGMYFVDGREGLAMNVERGVEIWKLGAERGDPNCQYMLGIRYLVGDDGLPESSEDAKKWFLAAAEQGHAIAELALAKISRDEGNDEEHLRYLRGSASKGCNEACYFLGQSHYNGMHGLQKSADEAIRVLTPAAERGHVLSMSMLGYAMCKPVPHLPPPSPRDNPNFTKGMHWYRRAAKAGDEASIATWKQMEEGKFSSACFMCDKKASREKAHLRCSRCRTAWYCSKDCQVQHWKADRGHKQCCIKLE